MTETTEREQSARVKDEDTAMLLQGEIAEALRTEVGLVPEFANPIAAKLTSYLRRRLGSQSIYIPAPGRAERDLAIYREFDGTNAAAVCARHNIGRSRLYQIVDEQRLLQRPTLISPISSLKTGQDGP
jgi:Mor family transcriptional regulator